jgi:Ca2+-binding RTX toxin-like protein
LCTSSVAFTQLHGMNGIGNNGNDMVFGDCGHWSTMNALNQSGVSMSCLNATSSANSDTIYGHNDDDIIFGGDGSDFIW